MSEHRRADEGWTSCFAVCVEYTTIRVPTGRLVSGPGTSGEVFGLVTGGRAGVTVTGISVAELNVGDWFGGGRLLRRSLGSGDGAAATIQAATELELALLGRDQYFEWMRLNPERALEVIERARDHHWA